MKVKIGNIYKLGISGGESIDFEVVRNARNIVCNADLGLHDDIFELEAVDYGCPIRKETAEYLSTLELIKR